VPILIDIKSGPVRKSTAYQLAAYKILIQENMSEDGSIRGDLRKRPTFRFDQDAHTYNDPHPILGVTDILKSAGLTEDMSRVPEYNLILGRALHAAIDLHIHDNLNMDFLDPVLKPRLDAWIRLEKDLGLRHVASEIPLKSERYGFAGQFDVYSLFKSDSWNPAGTIYRYGVQLDAEGKYNLKPFTDYDDEQVFLSALVVVKQQIKDGLK